MNRNFGVFFGQLRQARQQPARGKSGDGRQVDGAALALMRHQIQRVALQPLQPAAHLLGVLVASVGQQHAMAGAFEQGHTDKLFQRNDLSRNCTLCQ